MNPAESPTPCADEVLARMALEPVVAARLRSLPWAAEKLTANEAEILAAHLLGVAEGELTWKHQVIPPGPSTYRFIVTVESAEDGAEPGSVHTTGGAVDLLADQLGPVDEFVAAARDHLTAGYPVQRVISALYVAMLDAGYQPGSEMALAALAIVRAAQSGEGGSCPAACPPGICLDFTDRRDGA